MSTVNSYKVKRKGKSTEEKLAKRSIADSPGDEASSHAIYSLQIQSTITVPQKYQLSGTWRYFRLSTVHAKEGSEQF
jgi:hypothetical protein